MSVNSYYHKRLISYINDTIPANARVLEIGSGSGYLISSVNAKTKIGMDISEEAVVKARKKYPDTVFICADAEIYKFKEKFDYVILSDTLGSINDIQKLILNIQKVLEENGKLIITYHNFLWNPVIAIAEFFHIKKKQKKLNWLGKQDVENLLFIENFDMVKYKNILICPIYLPLVSPFMNKLLINLFPFNHLSFASSIIARKIPKKRDYSVSIIIPARNEEGNIEKAIERIPRFGSKQEIIFVEGNSTDDTYQEIKRVSQKYSRSHLIRYAQQEGRGKGDAVRKGFDIAENEILMILDADLTVPPEDLPKFYKALSEGKGEFINGTRLVYPLEKESMRFLNILGNKFFSLFFSYILGQKLKDTLCGTKVLTYINWKNIEANRNFFGDFDPFGDFDMLFGASKLNLKIVEIPIRYQAREYGDTNISRFSHGWLLLKMSIFALFKLKFR